MGERGSVKVTSDAGAAAGVDGVDKADGALGGDAVEVVEFLGRLDSVVHVFEQPGETEAEGEAGEGGGGDGLDQVARDGPGGQERGVHDDGGVDFAGGLLVQGGQRVLRVGEAGEHVDALGSQLQELLAQVEDALGNLGGAGSLAENADLVFDEGDLVAVIGEFVLEDLHQLRELLLARLDFGALGGVEARLLLLLLAFGVGRDEHFGGGVGQRLCDFRVGVCGGDLEYLRVADVLHAQRVEDFAFRNIDVHVFRHQFGEGLGAHVFGVGVGKGRDGVDKLVGQCGAEGRGRDE